MVLDFILNGKATHVEGLAPTTTLLDYLRTHGCTGSKQGCAEGDCGACTVAFLDRDAHGQPTYRAINSCIALLPMFAGREVITVDGLADGAKLHPAQSTIVEHYGSQCGYCTPGFVVSMFEAYNRSDCQTSAKISDQLCGNLCRCTGYRPIRDAALATVAQCGADKFKARLKQPLAALGELDYAAAGERFFRPTSLAALFTLKAAHPAAQLVAGATEIGVELNKKAKAFSLLISVEAVPELTQILETPTAWRIGAGATLTNVEEALGTEFPSLQKMLSVYASRQIRSRATLGGNIATASPIGDSAPLLLTLDAALVLTAASGERTVALQDFFIGYRKTVLRADEVIREIVVPRVSPAVGHTRCVDYFKVSKRREMDISIVAGAFRVETDAAGVVRVARLAFGGVAVTPVRALRAEAALLGKTLEGAAAAVAAVLRSEYTPIDDVRGGADFRRGLIVSLWEKFVSGEHSLAQDGALDFVAGAPVPPTDASRALRHDSAVGHVTGRALYVDDTAQRRSMLEVWPVMAPHARAKIARRDATKARACAGIAAVLLAEDIPGENNVGPVRSDEPMLATDEIQFHGQIVAIVVGDSIRACRAAAAMVELDYVPLPPLIGVRAAIAAGSFHAPPHELVRGDVSAALAAAPYSLEGEFEFGGQEHFYLETQAAWAEAGEDGTMLVHSSTQHPTEIQNIVAEVLHVARHKVVVQSARMGGGFGGKETQGNGPAAIVALAALKTGRPVRWQLDRDVDMTLTGKRHPFLAKFKVGYDADGRLLASQVDLMADGGWSLDLSQAICDRALFHLDNAYFIPAVCFMGRIAKTNVTSHTAFRGFGGPQGMLVVEEIVARIAGRLGLAPEVVRARNFYHGSGETNTTHYREDLGINRIQDVWNRVLTEAGFAERRRVIAAWNAQSGRVKRGLAVTPVKFGISFTLTHYNQAGALVLIYPDGSVQVNHGGTEMGQGLNAKMLGVAMRELGVAAEKIRLMPTSTDKVPNTSPTAASSGADLNGAAVRNACEILRERLRPVAAQLLAADEAEARELDFAADVVRVREQPTRCVSFAAVCQRAYLERVSLSTTGFYKTPGIHWDWVKAAGRPFHYFSYGASVSEVEVDGYTGMHRVRRVDIVHDVGDSLNPGIDRGQIEGGFVQGMGWLTREELKWDAQGRLLTHSASTYQIPAFSDAPVEMNVTLLPMAAQPNTIHGSKAVGEPPLMLAFSVREAIRDAVANFGAPGGEVLLASPATGEAIFAAVQARLK